MFTNQKIPINSGEQRYRQQFKKQFNFLDFEKISIYCFHRDARHCVFT